MINYGSPNFLLKSSKNNDDINEKNIIDSDNDEDKQYIEIFLIIIIMVLLLIYAIEIMYKI